MFGSRLTVKKFLSRLVIDLFADAIGSYERTIFRNKRTEEDVKSHSALLVN